MRLSYAALLHEGEAFDPAAAWSELERSESDSVKK
jgi:hypothetical protein